jgi:hypothetical protein
VHGIAMAPASCIEASSATGAGKIFDLTTLKSV